MTIHQNSLIALYKAAEQAETREETADILLKIKLLTAQSEGTEERGPNNQVTNEPSKQTDKQCHQ
jgi:hypothetical protein